MLLYNFLFQKLLFTLKTNKNKNVFIYMHICINICIRIFKLLFLKSVVTLGAAAGGILGGYLVDRVGRKLSLMLCSIPYVSGYVVIISAQNVWMLYFGRILTGLASGITSLVVPVSKALFLLVSGLFVSFVFKAFLGECLLFHNVIISCLDAVTNSSLSLWI